VFLSWFFIHRVGGSPSSNGCGAGAGGVGRVVVGVVRRGVVDDDEGTVDVLDEDVVTATDVEGRVVVEVARWVVVVAVDGGASVVDGLILTVLTTQSGQVVVVGWSHGPPFSVSVGKSSSASTTIVHALVPSRVSEKPAVKLVGAPPLSV
jgi:hypothetical protein